MNLENKVKKVRAAARRLICRARRCPLWGAADPPCRCRPRGSCPGVAPVPGSARPGAPRLPPGPRGGGRQGVCAGHTARIQLGCLAAPEPSEPPRLAPQVGISRCSGMQVKGVRSPQ